MSAPSLKRFEKFLEEQKKPRITNDQTVRGVRVWELTVNNFDDTGKSYNWVYVDNDPCVSRDYAGVLAAVRAGNVKSIKIATVSNGGVK